jgi:hypothetical protein
MPMRDEPFIARIIGTVTFLRLLKMLLQWGERSET